MLQPKWSITIIAVATITVTAVFFYTYPKGMVYSLLVGSLLLYFFARWPDYQRNKTPDDFFLYNRQMPQSEFVPTFVTSNIGLFSSIAFSTILAFYYGIGGMVFTVLAWFLGMYLFSKAIPKLLPFFKVGHTLHQFIGEKFANNDKQKSNLRIWTSLVSATLYFASIGIEVKVAADFFSPSLGVEESIYIALAIALIGIGYSYLSGYKGVVFTDRIQYIIMGLMTFAIIAFSVWHICESSVVSHFTLPSDYFKFPQVVTSPEPFGIVALIILMVLYQFCIMDMWQRCIAIIKTQKDNGEAHTDEEITKILQESTFKKAIVPFLWFFLIWFLIGIVALGTNMTTEFNQIIPAFLEAMNSYGNFGLLLKAIVFTGFAAAVLSTIDTFLIATTQTFMYDIYGVKYMPGLSDKISSLPMPQQYRFVHIARSVILYIGILSISFAFLNTNLLSFWTGMYSIMLPFFPAVWIAIQGKHKLYSFNVVKYSIILGFVGTALLGILGTFIYENTNFVYSATIFAVFFPIIILRLFRKNGSN